MKTQITTALVIIFLVLTVSTAAFGATLTVTKTADSLDGACNADCSLREAMTAAVSGDAIVFGINPATDAGCVSETGVCTLQPLSGLPVLTQGNIIINGFSQTGAVMNTADFPAAINASLKVVIDGTLAGSVSAFLVNSGHNAIKGLVIQEFAGRGVYVYGGDENIIQGCFIGVDVTGELDKGNGYSGVLLGGAVRDNIIGTDGDGIADAGERNLISNNASGGIYLDDAGGNRVAGNFIGTNKTGLVDLGNTANGIWALEGSDDNIIGTDGDGVYDAGEGNLVSGNVSSGIALTSYNNIVAGNYIGVTAGGNASLKNDNSGISITGNGNRVGTNGDGVSDVLERNIISGNSGLSMRGIIGGGTSQDVVVAGNYIGVGADGVTDVGQDRGIQTTSTTSNWIMGTNGDGNGDAGEGNVISGNVYNVYLEGTSHVIAGNIVGLRADGLAAMDSTYGVRVFGGTGHRVGTNADGVSDSAERNILSGQTAFGVNVEGDASNTVIAGNYIGTDITGAVSLKNIRGVNLGKWDGGTACSAVRVGTNGDGVRDAAERNVISGNDSGIGISNCAGAVIAGNYIGVAADGSSDLGNNNQGIEFIYTGGTNTVIGGDVSAEANVIAYNGNGAGEYGVKIAREASDGNQVLRNSLYLNENEGIYLAGDGANNDIAAPAITAQAADEEDLNISGNAGALETVQVFEADEDDEEGETYLAETQADGFGSWTITVPTNKLAGTRYVATTTDDTDGTSEFSPSYLVVNEAPEASPQTVSVTEDTQQTITLSGIDANADELDYSVTALPAQGSLYQTDDGVTPGLEIDTEPTVITDEHHRVIFVPEANESGAAYGNFSFQVDDGTVASAVALVTVNVSAVDDTVSTSASSASTQEDTAVTVLFSVTDPDEELLTYTIVSQPTRGSLSHLNAAAGSVRYTPSANQHGTDSFSFSVTDGVHTSNVSTVTLSLTAVNDAPLAQNSTASVDSGATVTIDLEASDVDGDSLTYQITTQPTHGTVSAFSSTNGTLTYTPESGYAGSDTIKFKVKDGSVWSSVATVSLTVSDAVNQPPVVSAGADRQVPAGARVPLKATASDDDGDTLTYLWTQTSGSQVALSSADSRNASFVAEDSLSGTTLSFQVAVTDGTDAATDHISIEVVSNEISSADALLLHEHVVGVDGGDEVISEKLEEMDAVEVSQLKLWNDCVIVATTDNPVTLLNIDARHLALGDPYADDETGTVIILDRDRLDCSTPIDFADEDLSGRTGVKVISGNQAGDRFGTTMKLGDIDGDDVFEIYVVAPGNGNGYVYGLNGVTLSIERLFIGAADKPLTSTLMEFGNFDGISGSECLFGLSVALGSDDNQTAVEDLTSLSVSAVSGFAGFSGTDAFPAVVNMAATESDYDLSSSIGISHLTKVDLDADAREDVLFGSGEACEIFILYGSDSFGAGDASVDTQVKVQCSEDTTFSTLVTSQDVTGDGFVDVIAGFPEAGDGAGRLLVLFGPLDPEQETYDMDHALVIEGVAGENLGTEVVVGDYDLDGIADLFATVLVGGEKKTKVLMLSSLLEGNSYATGGDSVSGGSGGGCSLQISNAAKTHEDWFMALNLFLVMLLSCVHRWRLESLQRNGIRRACHTIRIMPNYGIIFK